jgi:nitrate reductase NapE protein
MASAISLCHRERNGEARCTYSFGEYASTQASAIVDRGVSGKDCGIFTMSQPAQHDMHPYDGSSRNVDRSAKRREITMFLFLAFVIWPILAVAVVGGYGFLIWMSQLIMGPPGPPPV